ncbi:hypothetical protein J27TS8_45020 [Robertmurraya siralis]|uniref:Uncharacterized protein n=1 Tax=Robertmurraya siralis TaxID=77777 RepID=A0A919WML8_9BACI|nr:hypothetical protein J27TS8_45020 [Robertmurraya siralis]
MARTEEVEEARERSPECTMYTRTERTKLTKRSEGARQPTPNTEVKLRRRW